MLENKFTAYYSDGSITFYSGCCTWTTVFRSVKRRCQGWGVSCNIWATEGCFIRKVGK